MKAQFAKSIIIGLGSLIGLVGVLLVVMSFMAINAAIRLRDWTPIVLPLLFLPVGVLFCHLGYRVWRRLSPDVVRLALGILLSLIWLDFNSRWQHLIEGQSPSWEGVVPFIALLPVIILYRILSRYFVHRVFPEVKAPVQTAPENSLAQ